MMKFPWQRRIESAKDATMKAQNEYEWAVQQRTTVQAVVKRVIRSGDRNNVTENLILVIRGGHK